MIKINNCELMDNELNSLELKTQINKSELNNNMWKNFIFISPNEILTVKNVEIYKSFFQIFTKNIKVNLLLKKEIYSLNTVKEIIINSINNDLEDEKYFNFKNFKIKEQLSDEENVKLIKNKIIDKIKLSKNYKEIINIFEHD